MVPFFGEEVDLLQMEFSRNLEGYFDPGEMERYTDPKIIQIDREATHFMYNIHQMLLWDYSLALFFIAGLSLGLKFLTILWRCLRSNKVEEGN